MSPTSRQAIGFVVAIIIVGAGAAVGGYYFGYSQRPEEVAEAPLRTEVTGTIEVFEWAGYEVEELWGTFERRYPNVDVEFSFFVDEAEALTRLQAGYRPDIAHPCFASVPRWYDAGVIEPIDIELIPNYEDIFDDIKANMEEGTVFGGEHYFCPTDWGFSTVLFRPDLLEDLGVPKEDWNTYSLLFEPRPELEGKIMLMDAAVEVIPMAAITAGIPVDEIWDMTDAQLELVKDTLEAGKPLVSDYWTTEQEVAQAMRTDQIVAANIWGESFVILTDEGINVTYGNPPEGRVMWTCGFSIIKGFRDKNPELWEAVHAFMNSWLDPAAGAWLIDNYAYGSPNSLAPALVENVEMMESFGFQSTDIIQESIVWEYTPNEEDWVELWTEYRG